MTALVAQTNQVIDFLRYVGPNIWYFLDYFISMWMIALGTAAMVTEPYVMTSEYDMNWFCAKG